MLKKTCILFFLSSHLKTQTHYACTHMHAHIYTKKKSKRKNSAVERGYLHSRGLLRPQTAYSSYPFTNLWAKQSFFLSLVQRLVIALLFFANLT